MNETARNPFDKEPAEGSRETIEKQLKEQERRSSRGRDAPGGKVSDQPQRDATHDKDRK
jgi:hypothetical protein